MGLEVASRIDPTDKLARIDALPISAQEHANEERQFENDPNRWKGKLPSFYFIQ
jgi:hypothetical protein